jgi:tetratricopeptide (TPR) repeat protein
MARRESGDLNDAMRAFGRAIEINPSYAEAHGNLGATYLQCKQIDAAVRELQWAIQLRPEEPWLYHTLAVAQLKRRQVMAAAGNWCRATFLYFRRGSSSKT